MLRDIEKLKARVANLEIVSTVPEADVTINDVSVGRTPLAKPILVSAGRHKVTVSKAGFTAATKVIEIASGDSLKVPVEPVAQSAAPTAVVPVEVPGPPSIRPARRRPTTHPRRPRPRGRRASRQSSSA